jgi:type VI secretion system secreted protein VgrG
MPERAMSITTPLGGDVLLFHTLDVSEELGRLAEYNITVLSEKRDIDPDDLLGKHVTVKLELPKGGPRYFDAQVVRFALAGKRGRYYRYSIIARPWLWFLTRTSDCRIFQGEKAPDILKDIFNKYPDVQVKWRLTGNYASREYCVQYRETDFNFVSRLMEEEGIYYYSEHSKGKHVLVFADSRGGHSASQQCGSLPYVDPDRAVREDQDHVSAWSFTCEIQSSAYALDDYNFKTPSVSLLETRSDKLPNGGSTGEIYDYPGRYPNAGEGKHFVQIRLEELHADYELAHGVTNARGLGAGELFKLTGYPRTEQNQEYLVVAASHHLQYSDYESLDAGSPSTYDCSFTALASKVPFRPRRLTPKPVVQGVQPALVVGPAGDEIYTDEYGRVKVHFYWDRHDKKNENSSCWVRVCHPWAGKNWGMIHLPRIGQEVIVDFVEGDPDCPIITGRVYNAEQMPPWALPGNMTQSGILTRSTKGGTAANANAIRFEDKKGSEQLWTHAEKNQDSEVENDETHWVGHDRTKTVDHDETTHIKHDRTETVDNNETITIGANRTISVEKNESASVSLMRTHSVGVNEAITVGAAQEITVGAAQTITVGAAQAISVGANQSTNVGGNQSTSVSGNRSISVSGDQSVSVSGNDSMSVSGDEAREVAGGRATSVGKDDALKVTKNWVVDAGDSVTLKTGDASITMKKDGTIEIKGKDITVQGSGKITVKADGDIAMKGSKITQN